MPVISRFYGIVIRIYFGGSEHNPPHIHVGYSGYFGLVTIQNSEMLDGDLPEKALRLVEEWIEIHREELLEIWETQKFKKVKPL